MFIISEFLCVSIYKTYIFLLCPSSQTSTTSFLDKSFSFKILFPLFLQLYFYLLISSFFFTLFNSFNFFYVFPLLFVWLSISNLSFLLKLFFWELQTELSWLLTPLISQPTVKTILQKERKIWLWSYCTFWTKQRQQFWKQTTRLGCFRNINLFSGNSCGTTKPV